MEENLIIKYKFPKGFKLHKIVGNEVVFVKENFNLDNFIADRSDRIITSKDFKAEENYEYFLVISDIITTQYSKYPLKRGDICELRLLGTPASFCFGIKIDKYNDFLFYPNECNGRYLKLTKEELDYLLINGLELKTV